MKEFTEIDKYFTNASDIEDLKPFISDMLGYQEVKDYFKERIEDAIEDLYIFFDGITNAGALCYVGDADEITEIINEKVAQDLEDELEDESPENLEQGYWFNVIPLIDSINN